MALAVITINNQSPALDQRQSELAVIAQALGTAAQVMRSAGGTQTSGNIIGTGGVVLGTWAYTPQAAS